jgi:phenylacetic acid degradation operon negative regulatory protein
VNRRVRAWSRPARVRAWDGRWLLLLDAHEGAGDARARRLFGFADARPGLAVRPANLAAGAAELLRELRAVGLAVASELLVGEPADPETGRAWRGLWSGTALARQCARAADGLEASLARLPDMSESDALRETFERGGAAIRRLVYDPLLPDEIAPSEPRERLREAMLRYDAAGRARWGAFMGGFGLGRRRSLRSAPWDPHAAEDAA